MNNRQGISVRHAATPESARTAAVLVWSVPARAVTARVAARSPPSSCRVLGSQKALADLGVRERIAAAMSAAAAAATAED